MVVWVQSVTPAGVISAAVAYTGPVDLAGFTSVYEFWGLRAAGAAYVGLPVADITDSAGSPVTMTLLSLANGMPDVATLTTWMGSHTAPFSVTKLYGQVNGKHLTLAVPAVTNFPGISLSLFGGLPGMTFDTARSIGSAGVGAAQAQPFTISSIVNMNTAAGGEIFTDGSFALQFDFQNGGPALRLYAGSIFDTIITEVNTPASMNGIYNSASSALFHNGTKNTGDASTGGITNTNKTTIGATDAGGVGFDGSIFEVLITIGAPTDPQMAALVANQRAIGTGF